MEKYIIILGLKKSCVILHALAFSCEDERNRREILALVDAIDAAIKLLEA